jgi:hypothetical protein
VENQQELEQVKGEIMKLLEQLRTLYWLGVVQSLGVLFELERHAKESLASRYYAAPKSD